MPKSSNKIVTAHIPQEPQTSKANFTALQLGRCMLAIYIMPNYAKMINTQSYQIKVPTRYWNPSQNDSHIETPAIIIWTLPVCLFNKEKRKRSQSKAVPWFPLEQWFVRADSIINKENSGTQCDRKKNALTSECNPTPFPFHQFLLSPLVQKK